MATALGEGALRLNAFTPKSTLAGNGNSVTNRLASVSVSFDPDRVKRRAAVEHAGQLRSAVPERSRRQSVGSPALHLDAALADARDDSCRCRGGSRPAPRDRRARSAIEHRLHRHHDRNRLIGRLGSWRGLRAAQRPSVRITGTASSPQSVAS